MLRRNIHVLETQREKMIRQRRRQLLLIGVLVSMVVHIGLLMYLSNVYRWRPGSIGPQPVSFEFAIEPDDELTELESAELDDLLEPSVSPDSELLPAQDDAARLDADPPAAQLEVMGPGGLPTLGASGSEVGATGLTGGGAGTSFFGIQSEGRRFAYIVDRSSSMSDDEKMNIAKRELIRSIEGLPDYAHFFVVMFSSEIEEPTMQRGWLQARTSVVRRFIWWLRDVEPTGGTEPRAAFERIFALDERPDAIFFLTDGEIAGFTAEDVVQLNSRGRRVVINTIAFGGRKGEELLRSIADGSGGVYRYVPTGGFGP